MGERKKQAVIHSDDSDGSDNGSDNGSGVLTSARCGHKKKKGKFIDDMCDATGSDSSDVEGDVACDEEDEEMGKFINDNSEIEDSLCDEAGDVHRIQVSSDDESEGMTETDKVAKEMEIIKSRLGKSNRTCPIQQEYTSWLHKECGGSSAHITNGVRGAPCVRMASHALEDITPESSPEGKRMRDKRQNERNVRRIRGWGKARGKENISDDEQEMSSDGEFNLRFTRKIETEQGRKERVVGCRAGFLGELEENEEGDKEDTATDIKTHHCTCGNDMNPYTLYAHFQLSLDPESSKEVVLNGANLFTMKVDAPENDNGLQRVTNAMNFSSCHCIWEVSKWCANPSTDSLFNITRLVVRSFGDPHDPVYINTLRGIRQAGSPNIQEENRVFEEDLHAALSDFPAFLVTLTEKTNKLIEYNGPRWKDNISDTNYTILLALTLADRCIPLNDRGSINAAEYTHKNREYLFDVAEHVVDTLVEISTQLASHHKKHQRHSRLNKISFHKGDSECVSSIISEIARRVLYVHDNLNTKIMLQ